MAADARQHRAPVQDRRFVRGQPPIPRHLTRWLYSVVGANYARSVSRWRGKLRIASLRLLSPQNPLTLGFCGGVFSAYRTSSPLQNRLRWVLQGFLRGNCSPPQRTSMSKRVDISHVCGLRSVFIQVHPWPKTDRNSFAHTARKWAGTKLARNFSCQRSFARNARARGKITPPTALPRVMISRRRRVSRLHTPATVK